MSEATLTRPSVVMFQGADEFDGSKTPSMSRFERDNNSVLLVKDVPVFRSGSFRDSMGFQHEFDHYAMESMVRNYDHLKAQKIFSDVPVRNGHPSPFSSRMQQLVGYVTAMRVEKRTAPHDGTEYSYLVADYEILDAEAQQKIESGLWRNRSSEIGTYVDNRENEYGPAFLGVAYVDIPAVEGLNGFSKADSQENVHFIMEDQKMTGVITPPAPKASEKFSFSLGGQAGITDGAAVQEYINQIESSNTEFAKQVKDLTAERDELASFKTGIVEQARVDFVTGLADEGKILAPQKDALITLAKGLTDEQFETWKGSYESAPAQTVLGDHGGQESKRPSNDGGDDKDAVALAAFEADKQTLAIMGERMSDEQLKNTEAYASAIKYDPNFKL